MTTIERAWRAFLDAIEEAKSLHESGAAPIVVTDLLQHARELLDIIEDEAGLSGHTLPDDVKEGVAQMRARLSLLEGSLATWH